jgi:hypothetical protein
MRWTKPPLTEERPSPANASDRLSGDGCYSMTQPLLRLDKLSATSEIRVNGFSGQNPAKVPSATQDLGAGNPSSMVPKLASWAYVLLVVGFRRCRAGERDRSGEDPGIAGSRR